MKQYKHYSFDLWGTLIESNPAFKESRTEYFFDHFNREKMSHKEIDDIFRKVSEIHNTTAEVTGMGFSSSEMYTMVLHLLKYDMENLTLRDIHSIYLIMETLFIKHHPILFPGTEFVLQKLHDHGATISLLSNTGYARGTTMRTILRILKIHHLFQFTVFSDEIGISKPNIAIFNDMFTQVANLNVMREIYRQDIIHVGDSEKADIKGAQAAGIDAFKVNSDGATIKNLLQW